jgi:putative two-component system response regulator
MRVLIVDDDPIAVELLKDTLLDSGHSVECASNGRAALDLIGRQEFEVVVSDWEMPELDGLGLCDAIRRSGSAGYVYVILLTSHNSVAERVMAESRDPETGAHLERVQSYCRVLAQQLSGMGKYAGEIEPDFVRLLYGTSPLHDIGKVGIPDSVLLKPGRLSDREFDIMKTHTSIGAETLDAALKRFPKTKFLRMARDIAASHHERFDGSGYPAKLVGEDIPLSGRIVALADVYDALTSKRVYKDAFAHEVARGIILKESGSHFDPAIVEAFVAVEQAFIAIRDRFREVNPAAAAA